MKRKISMLVLLLFVAMACKKDKVGPDINKGLISYFNFDDNLKDQKGYTTDGLGNVAFAAGRIGKALSLNGIDQYVSFIVPVPQTCPKISVALWMNTSESGSTKLFLNGGSGSTLFAFKTELGSIGFVITHPNINSTKASFSAGQWTHVVGTFDGTDIKIYINGVLADTKNHPGSISGHTQLLNLGLFGGVYWAGLIDELYIYNRALSPEEVTMLYKLK